MQFCCTIPAETRSGRAARSNARFKVSLHVKSLYDAMEMNIEPSSRAGPSGVIRFKLASSSAASMACVERGGGRVSTFSVWQAPRAGAMAHQMEGLPHILRRRLGIGVTPVGLVARVVHLDVRRVVVGAD